MFVKAKHVNTFWAKIYVAGQLDKITGVCSEYCYDLGLCVTVTKTNFVFTGGVESGAEVGLINYGRFPADDMDIRIKAINLAKEIVEQCCQHTCSVVFPDETVFISRHPRDKE